MRIVAHTAICTLAGVLSSCAYLTERAKDFDDAFGYHAQFGLGIAAAAKASRLDVGVGFAAGFPEAGWGKPTWWSPPLVISEAHFAPPVTWLIGGIYAIAGSKPPNEKWVWEMLSTHSMGATTHWKGGMGGPDEIFRTPILIFEAPDARDTLTARERLVDDFGFEASVMAGFAGVRVGFNPLEFVDFLAGWFGLEVTGIDRDERRRSDEADADVWRPVEKKAVDDPPE